MIDCVLGVEQDTVAFCYFIAVNVIDGAGGARLIVHIRVGHAAEAVVFFPASGSVTQFSAELALVALGREGRTSVN